MDVCRNFISKTLHRAHVFLRNVNKNLDSADSSDLKGRPLIPYEEAMYMTIFCVHLRCYIFCVWLRYFFVLTYLCVALLSHVLPSFLSHDYSILSCTYDILPCVYFIFPKTRLPFAETREYICIIPARRLTSGFPKKCEI